MNMRPVEYQALLYAAEMRRINEYDFAADKAMMQRAATNAKKITKKKLFDTKKQRMEVEKAFKGTDPRYEDPKVAQILAMNKALKKKGRKEGA